MQSILSNQHDFLISILTLILTWTALLVNLPINFFHSSSETKKLLLPLSSIFVLSTTIVGILWFSQVNFIIITACLPLYEILSLAVLFTFLRKEIILKVTYFNINISKDIFRKSSWVAITMILATIYTRLDTIALNYWSNKVEMANYGVAYRLTEPFMFIGAAFSVSVYSQMSRMLSIESSRKKVLTATTKNVFLTLSYAMLAFTASYFLTPFAIHLFLKEYVVSIPVVRILSVAIIFRIINNSLTGIIQAHGYFTIITFVAAANVAISCLMIIIFSSIINATSIAVILCITEGFNTLVQLLILRTSVRNNLLS